MYACKPPNRARIFEGVCSSENRPVHSCDPPCRPGLEAHRRGHPRHRTRRSKDGDDRMTDITRLPGAGELAIIAHRV
jgi:hypothetical protein